MRLLLLGLLAHPVLCAGWEDVMHLAAGHRVEVVVRGDGGARAAFVSATDEAIVIREKSGERSVAKSDVRAVRVAAPERRMRNGLISTAVGLGAGLAIGWAVCPYCANEGHGAKFVGPGAAVGAGVGTLGFLPAPYRTVYRAK